MAYFEIYLPVLIFDGLRSEWLANGQVFPRECEAAIGNVTPWTELASDPAEDIGHVRGFLYNSGFWETRV